MPVAALILRPSGIEVDDILILIEQLSRATSADPVRAKPIAGQCAVLSFDPVIRRASFAEEGIHAARVL